jgi:PST family polysaccharide transporter
MAGDAAAQPESVSKRAIRGAAWTLPSTLLSRAVGLVGTILIARYLVPAEYGEVSAAAIVTTSAHSLTTLGLGIFLVTRPKAARAEWFHASTFYLATGAAVFVLVWLLARPLGEWFDVVDLPRFLPLLLASVALDRIAYVPERVLIRDLRFRWLSLSRAAGELAYTGVSLGLAMAGVGAMSIVWGNLARSAVRAVAIVARVGWRDWLEPHRLRLEPIVQIVKYGSNVGITNAANFAMRRWDNLIVSRFYGPAAMGTYNYAYNLADVPGVTIGEQLTEVVFAALPHVERENRAAAALRALRIVSLVMLPLALGLGAVGPTVATAFFDARWAGVGEMLALLSIISAARPIAGTQQSYLYACERPGIVLVVNWLGFVGMVASMAVVGRAGIGWTCAAVGIAHILPVLAGMWAIRSLDGTPISELARPIVGPLLVTAAMVLAVVAVRPALGGWPIVPRLLGEIAVGAVVYLAGAFLTLRSTVDEVLTLARSALHRR